MKVLMLTWEFPPLVTGGLGTACYGMVKAMLKLGTAVDLVIPACEAIFFPLRSESDADDLPVAFADGRRRAASGGKLTFAEAATMLDRRFAAYYRTRAGTARRRGQGVASRLGASVKLPESFGRVLDLLGDDYFLFQAVKGFTGMAIDVAARREFDVIHAHDWLTFPAGMALKHLSGKPLVVHVHSTEFDRACGAGDGRIHDIEYLGMKMADRVITVSGVTAETVGAKYCVPADKIRVAHNAFTPAFTERRWRVSKETTVVFMGRITSQKGPDYFLEVARKVLRHNSRVRFVMAGTGDMEKQILHTAASYGLGTRFLFAGFLKRDEVSKLLSAADVFVLPSVSEPFGIAPLEAMSHGAVAIISRQAGVAEIVQSAFKVDFWDVDRIVSIILQLAENPAQRASIAAHTVQEAAGMRWEEAARKIMEVYDEVAGPGRRSAG